jgi:hypothetical protein
MAPLIVQARFNLIGWLAAALSSVGYAAVSRFT